MKVSRRGLVSGGVGVAVAAAVGWSFFSPVSDQQRAIMIIRDIFGHDVLPEEDLLAFAHTIEFGGSRNFIWRFVDRTLPLARPAYSGLAHLGFGKIEQRLRSDYIWFGTLFIRATNYAYRAEGEPVRYLGAPDFSLPLSCHNPLASFDFDD
jgi:hypothetical protein